MDIFIATSSYLNDLYYFSLIFLFREWKLVTFPFCLSSELSNFYRFYMKAICVYAGWRCSFAYFWSLLPVWWWFWSQYCAWNRIFWLRWWADRVGRPGLKRCCFLRTRLPSQPSLTILPHIIISGIGTGDRNFPIWGVTRVKVSRIGRSCGGCIFGGCLGGAIYSFFV